MKKTRHALLLLICFALMANASAFAAYNVGVKNGDWMKYDINITAGQVTYAGTLTINIQSVNDTLITGTVEYNVPNYIYPTTPQPFSIGISTWSGWSIFLPIPAGLSKNDTIPGGGAVLSIGDWNGRKAVVANASIILGSIGQIYYDQATGVFLEYSGSYGGVSGSMKLVDTNLFSIAVKFLGLDWYIWVIIIVVVIAAVVVGVFMFMRKRRMATAPSTSSASPSSE